MICVFLYRSMLRVETPLTDIQLAISAKNVSRGLFAGFALYLLGLFWFLERFPVEMHQLGQVYHCLSSLALQTGDLQVIHGKGLGTKRRTLEETQEKVGGTGETEVMVAGENYEFGYYLLIAETAEADKTRWFH